MGFILFAISWVVIIAFIVGWLWIVVLAFSAGETLWGIGSFVMPLLALVWGVLNFGEAKIPVILLSGAMAGSIVLRVLIMADIF